MRTEIRVSLVLLGLFNSFVNVISDPRPVDSDCVIDSKPGVCKKISDCSSAWNKRLCNEHPPIKDVCCFSGREKVVCCPKSDPNVFDRRCAEKRLPARLTQEFDVRLAVATSIAKCDSYSSVKTQLRGTNADDQGGRLLLTRIGRSQNSIATEGQPVDYVDNYDDYGFGPRITNGTRAQVSEFPHMAAIGFNTSDTDIKWGCGGTLISEHFVLTAGHCIRDRSSVATWVQLGNSALNVDDPANRYRVADRIPHPEYKPPSLYNDIALLRLDREVRFDGAVHPACLQTEKVDVGLSCTATGWGITDYQNPSMSNDLLKVLIQVQQAAKCNATFSTLIRSGLKLLRGVDDESIICAGDLRGGNDTCQGDSGGPIQVRLTHTENMYSVIGVTSFGDKFCGNQAPSLYTRVSHFVPWIVSQVWPSGSQGRIGFQGKLGPIVESTSTTGATPRIWIWGA